jgi:eukaryotic-like serine/threonine-protein kinase
MFKFITNRPFWLNAIVGLALAIGVFSLILLSLDWITGHGKSATIPSVKGKKYEDAIKILKKSGFEVEILDSVYSDTVKPMMVLKQIPDADEVVKTNRTVLLVISKSIPPLVDMPNLKGYSLRTALSVLKNLDLKLGDTTFKPDFAKNAVLEQLYQGKEITPGTKIRKGSTVSFVLGDGVGDKQFAVPAIVGLQLAEAKGIMADKGITLGAIVADPGVKDTMRAWVYRQNPPRFDEDKTMLFMHTGQTMDVWLSSNEVAADSLMKKGVKMQKAVISPKDLKAKEEEKKKKAKSEGDDKNGYN